MHHEAKTLKPFLADVHALAETRAPFAQLLKLSTVKAHMKASSGVSREWLEAVYQRLIGAPLEFKPTKVRK